MTNMYVEFRNTNTHLLQAYRRRVGQYRNCHKNQTETFKI